MFTLLWKHKFSALFTFLHKFSIIVGICWFSYDTKFSKFVGKKSLKVYGAGLLLVIIIVMPFVYQFMVFNFKAYDASGTVARMIMRPLWILKLVGPYLIFLSFCYQLNHHELEIEGILNCGNHLFKRFSLRSSKLFWIILGNIIFQESIFIAQFFYMFGLKDFRVLICYPLMSIMNMSLSILQNIRFSTLLYAAQLINEQISAHFRDHHELGRESGDFLCLARIFLGFIHAVRKSFHMISMMLYILNFAVIVKLVKLKIIFLI